MTTPNAHTADGGPGPGASGGPATDRGPILRRLEQNLAEQIGGQERLLAAIAAHRTAMGALDLVAMRRAMDEVAALVDVVRGTVAARARLFDEAGVPTPAPKTAPRDIMAGAWAHVLRDAADADRRRIEALRQRARSLAARVERANRVNRAVNERALVHFESLLTTVAGGGPTYARRGNGRVTVKAGGSAALIDRVA